ncbi:hypothetical protein JTB14_003608 [Gonioctena quinquepunctata]|nr:hypothetical protein JTB14_003608 [Gonioctena quinquepunctata]
MKLKIQKEKSKEWKLLLNIFRKFSSQVSNAETQEEVIEDHSVIELDRFNNDDFYSVEEINDMPVVMESHPHKDIEDILILETNEEVSTRNKSEIELKEFLLWSQTPERKGTRQSERLPYVITSSGWKLMKTNKLKKKKRNARSKKTSRKDWHRRLSKKLLKRKPQLTKILPKLPKNMLPKNVRKTPPKLPKTLEDKEN